MFSNFLKRLFSSDQLTIRRLVVDIKHGLVKNGGCHVLCIWAFNFEKHFTILKNILF